jgi:hypothetical protein
MLEPGKKVTEVAWCQEIPMSRTFVKPLPRGTASVVGRTHTIKQWTRQRVGFG